MIHTYYKTIVCYIIHGIIYLYIDKFVKYVTYSIVTSSGQVSVITGTARIHVKIGHLVDISAP